MHLTRELIYIYSSFYEKLNEDQTERRTTIVYDELDNGKAVFFPAVYLTLYN